MGKTKVCYVISDIDKALAFEWITNKIDRSRFELDFILILQQPAFLELFLKERGIDCKCYYYRTKKDLVPIFWKVYRLIKKNRPAVVHCHLLYGSLIGLTAAKFAGVKKRIYTRHHSDYHHRYFPSGIKWDKWCNKIATHIVAPSGIVKEVLVNNEGVKKEKVVIIFHGFDLSYFSNVSQDRIETLKKKYQLNNQYPVIGVISRFTELKGIQFIIPAFKKLLQLYPDALIMFFNANGNYKQAILQDLKMIPEKNHRLIPFENDLAAVYPLFTIFIQASIDRTIESFGQTYVEALASGTPSIFTKAGIADDFIVDHENAIVVPFSDSEAIFNSMIEILSNKDLSEKLKGNGQRIVRDKFAVSKMIDALEDLYEN